MDLQKDGLRLSSSWLEPLVDFSGSPIQAWNQISFGNFSSQEINAAPQNLTSSVPMFFPGENSVLRDDPRTTQLLLNNTSLGAFGSLSPPPAPVTPGNNKFLQDERETAGQRSILSRGKEPITLCFDGGASELRSTEIETAEESNTPGVDFDKTPPRKPRRKKHRPKVIREGKPARTPNPSTPQKSTPRPPKPSDATPVNASGKRKYVRRNVKVNPLETPLTGVAEEVEARGRKEGQKSAKRRLEFPPDDEGQREESKSTAQEQEQKSSVSNEVVDSCLTSLEILPSLQFQPSRRELIRWNLKKLARMRNGDLIQWLNRTPAGTPLSFESHPRFGFDFVSASNVVNTSPNDAMEVLKKKRTGRARCRISVNTKESEKVNPAEKEQHQAHGVDFSTASEGKNLHSLETIIEGIKSLDINSQPRSLPPEETALVPYTSGGAIVSYESLPLKKVRPKVNLDEETNRVWNFLMGKESNGVDRKDKEKWWEEERRVFRGRVDSFIAKMHLVQGDRRFSPWKGSVLDSVIGVFLTQNVSDHLSSSAFMAMAARFPPVSGKVNSEDTSLSRENSGTCQNPVVLEGQEEFKVNALSSSTPDLEVNVQEDFDSSKSDFFFSEVESLIVDENPYNLDSNISFMKLLEMATSRNLNELYSFREDNLSNSERFPTPAIEESLKVNRQVSKANSENSVVNGHVSEGANTQRKKKGRPEEEKPKPTDWDELRREAYRSGGRRERRKESMDSLDWEAVKRADADEISRTIRERGMNNMLAARIKGFLERLEKEHGSIDLEWLRDVPPEKAKDFLLSIKGLGLKSVECVRLLTLHHLAFPVDTNVGRICVRLGWVPLQPLPESLQLHLLELYPLLETIQKYLWPRLCTLDQRTLYELHYQMITFGKVFCTKSRPNCNACPLRAECRHFASAFASARLALPGPEERRLVTTSIGPNHSPMVNSYPLCQIEGNMVNTVNAVNPVIVVNAVNGFNPVNTFNEGESSRRNCEPIIEEPDSPEPESSQIPDIEDGFYEDPDEIPEIRLNIEEFSQNLQDYMQKNSVDLESVDFSKAMVMISQETASIPAPKLKNISRLRTEHQVYELPDSHYLLEGLDRREAEDPSPYLLAIWSPGETPQSVEPPESCGGAHGNGQLCDRATCFSCNSMREAQNQVVRGTLLIPCRTAMRGSFPLNGTYFQVNEVFADHESSLSPINVPRSLIWNLPRRTVYFGTSVPTIFRGLAIQEIQNCFWRGFVCVRGFDRKTRGPRPLIARLHFPASKLTGNKRTTQRGDE